MENPALEIEPIFSFEHWHNHSSCVAECPDGGLLACWYHGSGERRADDVEVLGARKPPGGPWSPPFPMADMPDFPDTNPFLMIDGLGRLWLFYGTQLDNHWESTLLKWRRADRWAGEGPPAWTTDGVLHLKPDDDAFVETVDRLLPEAYRTAMASSDENRQKYGEFVESLRERAKDKLWRRLGWMGRCHANVEGARILMPLYSDGFDFSLVALSEDHGETWKCSLPMIGPGAVQPSLLRRRDGTYLAFCRNNGPEPKRVLVSESADGGHFWSLTRPITLLNYGSSVEGIVLHDGRWLLCYNDTGKERDRLVVALSKDEGRAWGEPRYIEYAPEIHLGSFHYPSVLQARDGRVHVTYTGTRGGPDIPRDEEGRPRRETIKHARLPLEWLA